MKTTEMTEWRDTYFLPEEVADHNTPGDCWIVIYGVVKDVTGLIEDFQDSDLVKPIIAEAGQDVSHWFDTDGIQPILRTCLHPVTGARVSALPFDIPHLPNFEPNVDWEPNPVTDGGRSPWWQDEKYNVGLETVRPIEVNVINPLIKRCVTIKVCLEDTVRRIMERYSVYNPEISSYMVEYLGRPLRMNWDLSRNGVALKFSDLVDDFVPTLMVRYQERLAPCADLQP